MAHTKLTPVSAYMIKPTRQVIFKNKNKLDLFNSGVLGRVLGFRSTRIYLLEVKGWLPKTWFFSKDNSQLYTQEQIFVLRDIAELCNFRVGANKNDILKHSVFPAYAHKAFQSLFEKYCAWENYDLTETCYEVYGSNIKVYLKAPEFTYV